MSLVGITIKGSDVEKSIDDLRALLSARAELGEKAHLDGFFRDRPWLLGFLVASADRNRGFPEKHSDCEFRISGLFRTDFLYTWPSRGNVVAVEIEGAMANSVFYNDGTTTLKWAPTFNRGFNQVVDWMHWFDSASDTERNRHFGFNPSHFDGLLIIGRRQFIDISPVETERFNWRKNSVRIHIRDTVRTIKILTYDDLLDEITDALSIYQEQRRFLDT
jgi:hypothetical protein